MSDGNNNNNHCPPQSVFTNYKVKVDAQVDTVWALLVDKIRRPDKFVPGVVKVEVLKEYSPLAIERRMELATGQIIQETISADEFTKTVIFKHRGDPKFSGIVTNTVYQEEDGTVFLEFVMTWTAKKTVEEGGEKATTPHGTPMQKVMEGMIRGATLKTKEHAEESEKKKKE